MFQRPFVRHVALGIIAALAACSGETTAPPSAVDGPSLLTAPMTATALIVRPAAQGGAANNLASDGSDAAPGFAVGSFVANAATPGAKSEMYFTPESMFGGRVVALGEVASIRYWTKTGATHAIEPRDWYLTIYTKPYPGDVSSASWYGDRIGAEPYFSASLNDPANTWNQWSTDGSANKLRFFESTAGAVGATFGSYTDPDWATLLTANALSGQAYSTRTILYFSLQTGSAWANGFTGKLDGLRVELIDGSVATLNFEPDVAACTTTCYADAVSGNDANSGASVAEAKKSIQAALNQVDAGGTVRVLPGTYNETAPNSDPVSMAGPATYQFGLFFGAAKPGITLMGVTAGDAPIAAAAATLATINTNATNNFGTSGIFVDAANTTIRGVTIGPNAAGDNKTIEVVADNFTLQYAATAVPGGGAIYLSEFDAPAGAVPTYHILNNRFADATQIAISSGAGLSGPVTGREITGNTFTMGGASWPAISFNGSGGVPWYTKVVGGATISGNTFSGGSAQYIRARGTYTESEFDWQAWWNGNTYDKGTVALVTESPFDVRTFSYPSAPYTFTNVRRIGSTVQGEVDNALTGDVVLAKAGSYPEQVTVDKDITVKGSGQAQTLVTGSACGGTGVAFGTQSSGATLQDVGLSGYNLGIQMLTGPLANITIQDVTTSNNCLHGVWAQAFGTTNIAFTRVTANGNGIGNGGRGIWMINGVKSGIAIIDGTFSNNGLVGIDISDGSVTGLTVTGNTVTGNGDAGIGVLGAQGPDATLVANNTVTNNGRFGIEMKIPSGNGSASGAGSVVVKDNVVSRSVAATDLRDYAGIAVFRRSVSTPINAAQPSGVVVTGNTVSGFTRKPSGSTGDGFGIVVEGTNHLVTTNIVSGNDVGIQIQTGNVANTQSTDFFDRGDANPSSAAINRNSITGNTAFDLRNVDAGLTDATCNWYGAASGPVASKVSGPFTTSPWLVTSDLSGGCSNTPPTVSTAAVDAVGNEGSTLSTSGGFSGTGLTLTASPAIGTFTPNNAAGTWTWSLATTDDVASASITVTATNAYGSSVSDQFSYQAHNVAPSLTITSPSDGAIYPMGATVSIGSSFTDPGTGDTHTCTYGWDDATTTGPVASGAGTCNASHAFATSGVYVVAVTVVDDNGGTDTRNVMVIVYDPSAGFVTGGGWINSPAGAYAPNPSLTGKATFGFVSKYKKGQTSPSGNTEFQFNAASLNFSSSSLEWLVVSGAKAQYKGSGTINGSGSYRFMLTVIDGQVSGGGGSDKFRIRIWNSVDGGLVYDNQLSAPDSADPTTTIGGGSIVIHK